jgi:hypothetical protein
MLTVIHLHLQILRSLEPTLSLHFVLLIDVPYGCLRMHVTI